MSHHQETRIYENDGRDGTLAYLPGELLTEPDCPLDPGDEIVAQLVPETGIVLFAASVEPDYPVDLVLEDPDRIAMQLPKPHNNQLCPND